MNAWEEKILDKQEAREEGLKEGLKESKYKIAKNMLAENLPVETILKCTGISKEELQKLQKEG